MYIFIITYNQKTNNDLNNSGKCLLLKTDLKRRKIADKIKYSLKHSFRKMMTFDDYHYFPYYYP